MDCQDSNRNTILREFRCDEMKRRFLISFTDLPVSRSDVKKGTNEPRVVTACRCVNVGLFLSHDMRRDVDVLLLIGPRSDLGVMKFPGNKLRRVAPDERSISFFILKANDALQGLDTGSSETLDNGIMVSRTTLGKLREGDNQKKLYIAERESDIRLIESSLEQYADYLYEIEKGCLGPFEKSLPRISRPANPERLILDVNMCCDRMNQEIKKSNRDSV